MRKMKSAYVLFKVEYLEVIDPSNPVRLSRLADLYLQQKRPLPSIRNEVAYTLTRRDILVGLDPDGYFFQIF